MKSKEFSLRARANSFRFAGEGIYHFFAREHNAWIHLIGTLLVFLLSWVLGVSRMELCVLVIVTGLVWVAEVFNTAIERWVDHIEPRYNPVAKQVKDLSAAAVLLAAVIALVTGGFIFIPKIF